jgi:hypothetical protein
VASGRLSKNYLNVFDYGTKDNPSFFLLNIKAMNLDIYELGN